MTESSTEITLLLDGQITHNIFKECSTVQLGDQFMDSLDIFFISEHFTDVFAYQHKMAC